MTLYSVPFLWPRDGQRWQRSWMDDFIGHCWLRRLWRRTFVAAALCLAANLGVGLPSQKFPSARCGSMLACKLLVFPSKLMRSNLTWSPPLRHPFSISIVLVQSHEACPFCWAVLSRMNLFYVGPSHQKVLGMKKNSSSCPAT